MDSPEALEPSVAPFHHIPLFPQFLIIVRRSSSLPSLLELTFWNVGLDATVPERAPKSGTIVSFVCKDHIWPGTLANPQSVDGRKCQWRIVPIARRKSTRQWSSLRIRETGDLCAGSVMLPRVSCLLMKGKAGHECPVKDCMGKVNQS